MEYNLKDRVLVLMDIMDRGLSNKEIGKRIGKVNVDCSTSELVEKGYVKEASHSWLGKPIYELTDAGKRRAKRIWTRISGENDPLLAYLKVGTVMESMFG